MKTVFIHLAVMSLVFGWRISRFVDERSQYIVSVKVNTENWVPRPTEKKIRDKVFGEQRQTGNTHIFLPVVIIL